MPNRFDTWKATLRGRRHRKGSIFCTDGTGDVVITERNTAPPNSTQDNLEPTSAAAKAGTEPNKPDSTHVTATQRTVEVLEVIPESNQELSQSEDTKHFYLKRTTSSSSSSDSKGASQLPRHYLEDLRKKDFSVLMQDLRTRLIKAGGHHTQHYLDVTSALEEKYNILLHQKYSALLQRQDGLYETADPEDEEDQPLDFLRLA